MRTLSDRRMRYLLRGIHLLSFNKAYFLLDKLFPELVHGYGTEAV